MSKTMPYEIINHHNNNGLALRPVLSYKHKGNTIKSIVMNLVN